jgi:hypothetical protein
VISWTLHLVGLFRHGAHGLPMVNRSYSTSPKIRFDTTPSGLVASLRPLPS